MKKKNLLQLSVFLQIFAIILLFSCNTTPKNSEKKEIGDSLSIKGDLVIFHAGSLSVPIKQMTDEFIKKYPQIKIKAESAGSVQCARKLTDLNRSCDIMALADYKVIDNMLIPKFADWNIKFASNEMAIVYNEKSRMADKINKDNWYEILLKNDIVFGRADPNSDPCGYRTVLTLKLSEMYYKKNGLAENMMKKDNQYIRPKEVDLLALLESHSIDYIFLYRSVAEQHNLKFLVLPDEINLKSVAFADLYSKVSVDINGQKPGEKKTMKGEPMVYGVTIPKNAPNMEAAKKFLDFMLSKGMDFMVKGGQPSLIPSKNENFEKIPVEFQKYVTK